MIRWTIMGIGARYWVEACPSALVRSPATWSMEDVVAVTPPKRPSHNDIFHDPACAHVKDHYERMPRDDVGKGSYAFAATAKNRGSWVSRSPSVRRGRRPRASRPPRCSWDTPVRVHRETAPRTMVYWRLFRQRIETSGIRYTTPGAVTDRQMYAVCMTVCIFIYSNHVTAVVCHL